MALGRGVAQLLGVHSGEQQGSGCSFGGTLEAREAGREAGGQLREQGKQPPQACKPAHLRDDADEGPQVELLLPVTPAECCTLLLHRLASGGVEQAGQEAGGAGRQANRRGGAQQQRQRQQPHHRLPSERIVAWGPLARQTKS